MPLAAPPRAPHIRGMSAAIDNHPIPVAKPFPWRLANAFIAGIAAVSVAGGVAHWGFDVELGAVATYAAALLGFGGSLVVDHFVG